MIQQKVLNKSTASMSILGWHLNSLRLGQAAVTVIRSKNDQLQDRPTSSWAAQSSPSDLRPPRDTLDDGRAPYPRDCGLVSFAWLVSDCCLWRLQHHGRCCRGSSLCRRYPKGSRRVGYRRRCLGLVYQFFSDTAMVMDGEDSLTQCGIRKSAAAAVVHGVHCLFYTLCDHSSFALLTAIPDYPCGHVSDISWQDLYRY